MVYGVLVSVSFFGVYGVLHAFRRYPLQAEPYVIRGLVVFIYLFSFFDIRLYPHGISHFPERIKVFIMLC